ASLEIFDWARQLGAECGPRARVWQRIDPLRGGWSLRRSHQPRTMRWEDNSPISQLRGPGSTQPRSQVPFGGAMQFERNSARRGRVFIARYPSTLVRLVDGTHR